MSTVESGGIVRRGPEQGIQNFAISYVSKHIPAQDTFKHEINEFLLN